MEWKMGVNCHTLVAFIAIIATSVLSCGSPPSALVSTPIPAAECKSYDSVLSADGSLGFCNGIVDYQYYLPGGKSQADLEQLAQYSLVKNDATTGLLLSILPPTCSYQLKKVVCMAVFQACELVDPFFLENECPTGTVCSACGHFGSVFAPNTSLTYGSVCRNPITQSVVGGFTMCSAGPGKVPGYGNMGWPLLAAATVSPSVPMTAFCRAQNLTWSESAQSCLVAVPRSPCKSECDKVWSMNRTTTTLNDVTTFVDAVCPIVSGNWNAYLTALAASDPNEYVRTQAQSALDGATAAGTSISLLAAFQLGPKCNDTAPEPNSAMYTFSSTFTQEFASSNRQTSVGLLIYEKASALQTYGVPCHCTINQTALVSTTLVDGGNLYCDPTKDTTYCDTLANRVALCNAEAGSTKPNPSVRFVGVNDDGMLPICKAAITKSNNQPSDDDLLLMKSAFNLPSLELAKGAFFVPPTPGLPALATGSMSSATPLCAIVSPITHQVFTGTNSYECAVAATKAAATVVPPVIAGPCRLAFLDMVCNTAHMKLEIKSMCLLPNGAPCKPSDLEGAASNEMPFIFALPRFPARSLCTNFKTQCAEFLDTQVGVIGTPQRDLIEATFNCTGPLEQTCAGNNPLSGWTSDIWSCNSSFNGKPAYPAASQQLVDLSATLGPYAVVNNLPDLGSIAVSSVSTASISDGSISSISTCECPAPLLVPQDPNAPTAAPGVCCQERCNGHMYSETDFESMVSVQKICSIMSLIGTFFILATWGTFRIKRSQPLTFFFALASFNISLTFLIPDYYKEDVRDVWCKDNTQQNVQSDGGMCLFQSIWLTFWVICACCFWLVQGFDLYLRIVHNKRHLEHLTKFYHAFAWGIPALILAIMLGENAMGYEKTFFWCFLRDITENQAANVGLDLGMFYGTIVTLTFTGFCLMVVVLWKIWKITSKTSGTAQVSNTTMKRLVTYRTPVFFVLFFVYVWISIFAWRFGAEVEKNALLEAGHEWGLCLITNFASGIPDPATNPAANTSALVAKYGIPPNTGCGSTYPLKIRYSDYVYLLCITGLQGVFIFIIFGAKMENFNLWKEKLGLTTKKYDTTAEDSSTKDKTNKPSVLSNAMSSLFTPASPAIKSNDSVEKDGGSAVMVNGLQSGKFMAVTEPDMHQAIKPNQVAAAYMSESS